MHGTLNIEQVDGDQVFIIRLYPKKANFDEEYHASCTGIIKGNDFIIKGLSGKFTKQNYLDVGSLVFDFFVVDRILIRRLNNNKLFLSEPDKNNPSMQVITKERYYKRFRDS